ncbi:MAG: hypothetical protein JXP36_15070 [Bacteroidales bacterium]|nr:hypothetical protein [Bacteroidales bacterium]
MNLIYLKLFLALLLSFSGFITSGVSGQVPKESKNAADFGLSTEASGIENTKALQNAVDHCGTVMVTRPGVYKIAGTVYIGSNTSLIFGNNVVLQKTDEQGKFSHVLVNKGAKTKTYNNNITIKGLQIMVNGIDTGDWSEAYGLRGQLAFFYVRDLRIERFRCLDLGAWQYGIQVCTFEDLIINDVIIKGDKDGVHLGRGKRFKISNGVFQTYDDAIALNAHDYSTGNPELGWIENGVIENCHDLNQDKTTGFFCRILAGAWKDWEPRMEVQQSDAVVFNNRIYRVQMQPDGKKYISNTPPIHENGNKEYDGINWGVVQTDITYTAGVRNVVFRDIFLEKPRVAFSVHFDNDKYSRSYYPGAITPIQEQLLFVNILVLHDQPKDFLSVNTPMDVVTIINSSFRAGGIHFHGNKAMTDYQKTKINIVGSVFNQKGEMVLVKNSVDNKRIELETSSNIEYFDDFSAKVVPGTGQVIVNSDLTGLKH